MEAAGLEAQPTVTPGDFAAMTRRILRDTAARFALPRSLLITRPVD